MGSCLRIFDFFFSVVHPKLGTGPFDENSSVLKLKDFRQLGYLIVGADVKIAQQHIFYHHGHPSSRLDATCFDLSCFPNICIISVDRPGSGLSEHYTERKVSDHVLDVLALADHLGIKNFGVIGHSGGGPYALAARVLIPPERLDGVVCVAGVGPTDVLGTVGMMEDNVATVADPIKAARMSRIVGILIGNCCGQLSTIPKFEIAKMPKADQDLIEAQPIFGEVFMKSFKEGLRHKNLDTFVEDMNIYGNLDRWGFKREDAKGDVPFVILQGDDDNNVPPSHAAWYGETPGARVVIAKGHGHLSVIESKEFSKLLRFVFSGDLDSYPGFKPAA